MEIFPIHCLSPLGVPFYRLVAQAPGLRPQEGLPHYVTMKQNNVCCGRGPCCHWWGPGCTSCRYFQHHACLRLCGDIDYFSTGDSHMGSAESGGQISGEERFSLFWTNYLILWSLSLLIHNMGLTDFCFAGRGTGDMYKMASAGPHMA